jgi:hypothetical protein
MIELFGFVFYIILVIACGTLANRYRRSVLGWSMLSLLLTPLVIIILLCLGEIKDDTERSSLRETPTVKDNHPTKEDIKDQELGLRVIGFGLLSIVVLYLLYHGIAYLYDIIKI